VSAEFVWYPSPETTARSNVGKFMRRHGISDFRELVRRSQEEPDWFWPAVVKDLQLEFFEPWTRLYDDSRGPEWTTWFVGGKTNIAQNCVHRWAGERRVALVGRGEDGSRREVTFPQLSYDVTRLAEGLLELGVGPGDTVGIYLPMAPEVAVASHACAHIGAIQVPIFSGFAAPAVASRLVDSECRVVITADASLRRGKAQAMKAIVDEAGRESSHLEHVVVWQRLGTDVPMLEGRDVWWHELLERQPGELHPLELDSEHPYLLAYTSGTTGKPKGVVHVHGGFLVSIAREAGYQTDITRDDVVHFSTDMGWIMGPWTLVGAGAFAAPIVFAEGAPDWPPDRLWRLVEEERVTMLGLSPTLVRALLPHGDPTADLSSLRTFCTTGEPWNPDPYMWLHERVGGGRCPIVNISGGTEIGACLLSVSIAMPIKACSLGGPALGMAVDVVDDEGLPVRGEVGELVCRKPWPGMTRGLWRDPERYLDSYWRRLPGVWVHGDWASVDEDGYWFLHGRSDDTLNIAGKRIGPAELESAAVSHPAVQEAACVGIPHAVKGEVAWIFCVAAPGREPTDEAADEVAERVAAELGRPFKPDRVLFVPALPKTRSAKIVRRAVRAKALGTDPGDLSSLENPEALEEIARAV
jgi:acetyl-CoA synthetase